MTCEIKIGQGYTNACEVKQICLHKSISLERMLNTFIVLQINKMGQYYRIALVDEYRENRPSNLKVIKPDGYKLLEH